MAYPLTLSVLLTSWPAKPSLSSSEFSTSRVHVAASLAPLFITLSDPPPLHLLPAPLMPGPSEAVSSIEIVGVLSSLSDTAEHLYVALSLLTPGITSTLTLCCAGQQFCPQGHC